MRNPVWRSTRDLDRAGLRQTVVTTYIPAATDLPAVRCDRGRLRRAAPAGRSRPRAAERIVVRLHAPNAGGPAARARRRARPPEPLDLVPAAGTAREALRQAARRHAERLAAERRRRGCDDRGRAAGVDGAARGQGAACGGSDRRADPATARCGERPRTGHRRADPDHPRRDRRGRLRAPRAGRRGSAAFGPGTGSPPVAGWSRTSAGSATRRAGTICRSSCSDCRVLESSSWCAATARGGDGSKGCWMQPAVASSGR